MAVNLREFAEIYRPYAPFRRGFGGDPALPEQPEFRRGIWCRINSGVSARTASSNILQTLTALRTVLIIRWNDLDGITVTSDARTKFSIIFNGDTHDRHDIIDMRPSVGTDPRTYCDVTIEGDFSGGLPFTYLPPEATTETIPDDD